MTDPLPSPCPLCGSPSQVLEAAVEDVYFGYPGSWRLDRCSASDCAIVWIANPLPADQLSAAYARYYTHEASPPGAFEVAFGRWIGRRCRTHGDRFPALPFLFREGENRLLDSGAIPPDPHGVALDVGCGAGERLDYLRAIGWGASAGIDPDPVAVARGVAAGRSVRIGSAEATGMDDNVADIVLLHHVVEHLADIRPALAEMARVLRGAGHVVITTPNPDAEGRAQWGRWWRGYEAPRHLRLYTLAALRRVLEEAGFSVRYARTSARAVPFMTSAAARATGTALPPAWARWWLDDRAILGANARIRTGKAVGEELFVVAQRQPSVI
jgi:SAM-dependent methyltransferase